MTKRYRAYDETTDRWKYFKLTVNEEGWQITFLRSSFGDKSKKSISENFEIAYLNLLQLIEQHHLTKLTEIDENMA